MAKTPKTKTDSPTSLPRRIRICKVKLVGGKTLIDYEVRGRVVDDSWDAFSLKSSDEPVPEMVIAIKSLAPHVCEICELPKEWESNVIVHSVALSYNDDAATFTGAVISARKVLTHGGSPFLFNTPHRPVTSKDVHAMLPAEAVMLINEVCDHAEEFINGKRKQARLFDGEMLPLGHVTDAEDNED